MSDNESMPLRWGEKLERKIDQINDRLNSFLSTQSAQTERLHNFERMLSDIKIRVTAIETENSQLKTSLADIARLVAVDATTLKNSEKLKWVVISAIVTGGISLMIAKML